jgi:hypothetical protein
MSCASGLLRCRRRGPGSIAITHFGEAVRQAYRGIRVVIARLDGHWRPMLLTAIFTGLRASELRRLPVTIVRAHASAISAQPQLLRLPTSP